MQYMFKYEPIFEKKKKYICSLNIPMWKEILQKVRRGGTYL